MGSGVLRVVQKLLTYTVVVGIFALFGLVFAHPAKATPGVNQQINFVLARFDNLVLQVFNLILDRLINFHEIQRLRSNSSVTCLFSLRRALQ